VLDELTSAVVTIADDVVFVRSLPREVGDELGAPPTAAMVLDSPFESPGRAG